MFHIVLSLRKGSFDYFKPVHNSAKLQDVYTDLHKSNAKPN